MGTEIQSSTPDRVHNGRTIHIYGVAAVSAVIIVGCWIFADQLRMIFGIAFGFLASAGLVELARRGVPIYIQASRARHEQVIQMQDLQLREQVISIGRQAGYSTRFEEGGTIEVIAPRQQRLRIVEESPDREEEVIEIEEPQPIPEKVRYEDIRVHIPRDHALVGIGEGGVVHTLEKEVKGLIWIPGSSGAGKSNTTGLRVDEDYERGHRFLGIDPHFFKDDSLSNLVKGYMDRFIEPIAYRPEDILRMLDLFIAEVARRQAGGKCWPLTLLYDEIGSQVSDKPEDEIEKQIIEKTKKVIRKAGQETRGFNMNVIAISQDAAGLAFLRKRALLVLGHKTVMMSERELICNERSDIARQMDMWPVGRTVVYGVAVQGVLVRQQPLMTPRSDSSKVFPDAETEKMSRHWEANGEDAGRPDQALEDLNPVVLKKFLNEAGKMRAAGQSIDSILKAHSIAPGGRNNQNLKSLLEQEEQGA